MYCGSGGGGTSADSEQPQQWSVHAEFTISHPGVNDPNNLPQTHTEHVDNAVRMTYIWTSPGENPQPSSNWSQSSISESATSCKSHISDKTRPTFQKGNLCFSSIPPAKLLNLENRVQDSGYGSDLLSPNSSGSLPRRPFNRKCRSTCNIILQNRPNIEETSSTGSQCGRTQSLRCQTPTMVRSNCSDGYYGCGDPWCHHLHYGDDFGRISPVLEVCEECTSTGTRRTNFSCPTCNISQVNRRDASVQTFEMIDKCTSPFLKMTNFNKSPSPYEKPRDKRKIFSRSRTEPICQKSHSQSSFTPDSLDSYSPQKLTRSTRKLPKAQENSSDKSSDNSKKPRTVHIDVYCTGTEMESSSSDSESGTASTPQTVFESEKVRITHKKADANDLPYHIKKSLSDQKLLKSSKNNQSINKQSLNNQKLENTSIEREDSDIDDASIAYPSKMSSYSTIRDFSSSISSVPCSWTSYSMSSCTVPDDYDSIANTSWKDTFSDIDSLLHSKSSITQTDSLDFVPRQLDKNCIIDEMSVGRPELTPSTSSLQPSDSFEYANSEDRLRIKRLEEMLDKQRRWRSPRTERKLILQKQKMQEYMERKIESQKANSDSGNSDDDDEKGWVFVKNIPRLGRESTVRQVSKEKIETKPETIIEEKESSVARTIKSNDSDKGNISDSSCRSPSILALKQRLSLDPTLRAPFSILPGLYTESRFIAKKFGSVVNVMKKPGHHIGPAKNPDCMCDHCQRYFENIGYRNRTRSVGDSPSIKVQNWREFVRPAQAFKFES